MTFSGHPAMMSLIKMLIPYAIIMISFISFVAWNGSVVLGTQAKPPSLSGKALADFSRGQVEPRCNPPSGPATLFMAVHYVLLRSSDLPLLAPRLVRTLRNAANSSLCRTQCHLRPKACASSTFRRSPLSGWRSPDSSLQHNCPSLHTRRQQTLHLLRLPAAASLPCNQIPCHTNLCCWFLVSDTNSGSTCSIYHTSPK